MSGGHFDYNQYRIEEIADDIDRLIRTNNSRRDYPPDILNKFREAEHTLRQAADMVQRVDWLVSCDDGEESFRNRWAKEVRPYWNDTESTKELTKE